MKHNEAKLEKLNQEVHNYYYSIEGRDYVHSTTFLILVWRKFRPTEITLYLRKVVTTGFYFDDAPGDDDIGYVQVDSSIYYIKNNQSDITAKQVLESDQELLLHMNNVIKYSYPLLMNDTSKIWSKKLYIYCPSIFLESKKSIDVRCIGTGKHTTIDSYIDGTLSWRHCIFSEKLHGNK